MGLLTKMLYEKPSSDWLEGLPIGNGRLAAMVWGNENKDILTLNHEWLWRGKHRDRKVVPAYEHLEEVRNLLKEGNFFKANLAANLYFAGEGGVTPNGNRVDPYQPAGTLEIEFSDCEKFISRELDIEKGLLSVKRKNQDAEIIAEYFVSSVNGLIMSKVFTKNSENIPFSININHARIEDSDAEYKFTAEQNSLIFNCQFKGGINYRVVTEIKTDGKVLAENGKLIVSDAKNVEFITNIATSVFDLENEVGKYSFVLGQYETEKQKHSEKFSGMMNGVHLSIDESSEFDGLSIEKRLERVRNGERDNGISTLYFDFGRYLMISSSILGDLPANLQGKWSDKLIPDWDSDYHFDINLEMNYWMSEPCNLSGCSEALLKYVETFYESGREAAQKLYGCRGIYLPIQGDAWGISTPESFGWAVWLGAAPWIAQNFWKRYVYTGDIEFLRTRGFKYFKEVAEFFEDYLVEDENGIFQAMPSQSPENTFCDACGYFYLPVGICISSAMDIQLIYDVFDYAVKSAGILGIENEQVAKWRVLQSRLPEFKIGEDGRLLEWNEEKKERPDELGHRHLSHLYGAFPGQLFTSETRVPQYEAAKKSLEFRLKHGGGHTGWSRAWVSCLQSRFGNSEGFYEHFITLIRDFATVTLLDLHPPGIFQIDGNLGGVMAVIEAIISCTDGKIHLLRSVPKEWEKGSLSGIKTPGGHTVSVSWENGKVTALDVKLGYEGKAVVKYNGIEKIFSADV
jgi:alpha-L-fucosidase 2